MANSSLPHGGFCHGAETMALLRAWLALYLLVLVPPSLCVLYVGCRRRSAPSHSDVFTYHLVVMEMVAVGGACLYSLGAQTEELTISRVGDYVFDVGVTAQMQFHTLTCGERYLAVVHPITYLRLKKRGGVTIRNAIIAGAWLISAGVGSVDAAPGQENDQMVTVAVTIAALLAVSFCSVSVLRVLIRPGPGGGALRRVDQSKRRAFLTIAAILGVLLLRFFVLVPANLVMSLKLLPLRTACLFTFASSWFYLPSSLVSPLMFLHRARKRP